MSQKNHEDQLEKYLLGHLNGDELKDFEQELASDEDLSQLLKDEQDLLGGVEAYGNQQLRQQLKGIHQEVIGSDTSSTTSSTKTSSTPTSLRIRWQAWVAAAAIALLAIVAYWNLANDQASPEELFATYYQAHPIQLASRAAGDDAQLVQLSDLYKDEAYEDLLTLADQLNPSLATRPNVLLAKGIAYLEQNQYAQAQEQFNQILQSNDAFFSDHASWYMALTHLKQNQINEARVILEQLAQSAGADHQKEAAALLKEL